MNIYLAFLVKDQIHHLDHWQRFADALSNHATVQIGVHCHADNALCEWSKAYRIPTVPTSHPQTITAHKAFINDALNKDADRFLLFSETCLPIAKARKVYDELRVDKSWFHYHENMDTAISKAYYYTPSTKRKLDRWVLHHKLVYWSEQWYILTKSHMAILKDDADMIVTEVPNRNLLEPTSMYYAHRNCWGDNESWAISTLKWKGESPNIINYPTTFTDWINRSKPAHPREYLQFTMKDLIEVNNKGSWFVRKVLPQATINVDLKY